MEAMSVALAEFNSAPDEQARAQLRSCLNVARWIERLLEARPFASVDAAVESARHAAHPLTPGEIDQALADHPRIGERTEAESAEAEFSRREQAGLGEADASVEQRLAAGNRAYEQRFGRVFLIRAAGRSHEEILAELERRLQLDPAEELEIAGEQLEQIAALRLEGLLR
ncbi:2-oxo-4-hydroxy-4-carboxy-5-ureidoimidazoline decarboxylase [Nesterenkonia sp. HG001]|nr:2-oxo-4-hydroxy-4-carboxy-5-ureidoimidazoline decarboxylase [Nesterenkonia sp. HG001]